MKPIFFGIALVGGFLIYEAVKGFQATPQGASAAMPPNPNLNAGPVTQNPIDQNGVNSWTIGNPGGRLLPASFYNGLAASESPLNNLPCYGGGCSYFGISGEGPLGSHLFSSQGGGVNSPLALFANIGQAMDYLDRNVLATTYAVPLAGYQRTGNLCQFIDDIALGNGSPSYLSGYAPLGGIAPNGKTNFQNDSDWAASIKSLSHCQ